MKKLLSILLAAAIMLSMLPACGSPATEPAPTAEPTAAPTIAAVTEPAETEPAPTEPTPTEPAPTEPVATEPAPMEPAPAKYVPAASVNTEAIKPLGLSRKLSVIRAEGGIQPYAEFGFGKNAVTADLSNNPALAYSLTFSNKTRFQKMPAGYDPAALLEWGKYPGLNVDILHKHGFTGKGAVIAYVDQPIANHPAYANVNLHYTNNSGSNDSMHGPSVLSMLAGQDIGTAPEAEVYFYGHAAWLTDQTTHAECLYQIIEQNKSLPEEKRIRMVGFSDNPDGMEKNVTAFNAAVRACEEAGIMVWFCAEYAPASFLPMSNKNDPQNLVMEHWWGGGEADLVFVPAAGRTAANQERTYTYWASGGLSWTMPYILGLYGIAIEIDPTLTQDDIRTLVKGTAYDTNGMRLINPVGFIAKVLQDVGRDEEAQAMLDEVAARTKYLYAVMDTAAMSDQDLSAVSSYLADITDATVLVADAASFSNAEALYTALQEDARNRGGQVAGVQIFGTPDMVPAFTVNYKVRMGNNTVDNGGPFLTDLFYGNFNNDPARISKGYNVMDHFEQGWDVDLIPQWPVARLPLSEGEYAAFFEKYDAFLQSTGLQRQDLVNFSNPIFRMSDHIDDMGAFLNRMHSEFRMLDIPYRLYGNRLGSAPVRTATIGGFTAEELAAENEAGIAEFVINSHGQWNNIDKCFFEGGQEKRESLINMDTIHSVLDDNPYYLDCWTCNNGYGMKNNLTTTALNGNCVGMFSATAIISNNGVNCRASVPEMAKSNFYYFYYHYLKALHEGQSRSAAFQTAQAEYAAALIADSANGIRNGEGNYQFNLCNLLAYHNFGVIEPNRACITFNAKGHTAQAEHSVQKEVQSGATQSGSGPAAAALTDGSPVGEAKTNSYRLDTSTLQTGTMEVHNFTRQQLDNQHTRFTLEFKAPAGMSIYIFDPPQGIVFSCSGGSTSGEKQVLVFDVPDEILERILLITISIYFNDNDRAFVVFNTRQ